MFKAKIALVVLTSYHCYKNIKSGSTRFKRNCVVVQSMSLKQCWFDAGPPSATLAQHQTNTGSMSRVRWVRTYKIKQQNLQVSSL